ncbi:hypothetical protein HQ560_02275 [bacterium]|nr:hypothetical protein [bacterium]
MLKLSLMICMALPATAGAKDWSWRLAAERYKKLNVFQRAQYDKAARALDESNYQGASSEFMKFKVQFPDSTALSYVLFMRGYCLHKAKMRNNAIKVYTEVLDYFGDNIEDAAPALYFMGSAYIENGDVRDGIQCMQEMVEDEEYCTHALAAGALRHLADNHWKNKELAKAVTYWKRIVAEFSAVNHYEASAARSRIIGYYVKNKDYAGYENWRVTAKNRDSAKYRVGLVEAVMHVARGRVFNWHSKEYGRFDKDARAAAAKACFEYLQSRKSWYDKAGSTWTYYDRAISFLSHYHHDKKMRDRHIDEAVAIVKKEPDRDRRHYLLGWLVDRLREARDYERARYIIGLITDPPLAAYKGYELLSAQQKWAPAAKKLEDIEKMGDAKWAARAMTERANLYKDRLGRYEDAIKLYHQINNVPWTLWQIQDAYIRWGKLKDAITTLSEIENSFPSEASKAAWHKASYYHEAKMAKMAIAHARKILKAYKTSQESSLAHQLLEKYGIQTGGGVFDEE